MYMVMGGEYRSEMLYCTLTYCVIFVSFSEPS